MEELKPRIKPKAPASLKKNVLEAVRSEKNSLPSLGKATGERMSSPVSERLGKVPGKGAWAWLSAAATVLTVGIMTFTFWPRTSTEDRTNTDVVASVSTTYQPSSQKEEMRKQRSQPSTCSPSFAQTAAISSTEKPSPSGVQKVQRVQSPSGVQRVQKVQRPSGVQKVQRVQSPSGVQRVQRVQITATPTEDLIAATPAEERLSTPLPRREGQGGESGSGLGGESSSSPPSPYEQQLLANFEKHRDLVNACLAEELAQTRMTQNYLRQIQRQSLQDYLDLQQNIQQQVREAIDELRQEPNVPQTV
ncbi:MAG: hypothetical protein IJ762_09195 [Bacteroidaceae bacterium]|nr:hypothetical protein [Bacteroidaceae bacterium]